MVARVRLGDIGGGDFGLRVSKPGFDVTTETFGSANISFDSRLQEIGLIVAEGQLAIGSTATFPVTLSEAPVVEFWRITGSTTLAVTNSYKINGAVAPSGFQHGYVPYLGLATTTTFQIIAYSNPWYATATGGGEVFYYRVFGVTL